MKLAVMQPYIFPYIGYFQLIHAVDIFVFYDDVNYIKGGWINRNRILFDGKDHFLTIPCIKASPNRSINEIAYDRKKLEKLTKTLRQAYIKAPYFNIVFPIIEEILNKEVTLISQIAIESVVRIAVYLQINTQFLVSSKDFLESKGQKRSERLINICKNIKADHYINSIGGRELYDKDYFAKAGIRLDFIQSNQVNYRQFKNEFIPGLSIIDVLMFNSKEEVLNMLNDYTFL